MIAEDADEVQRPAGGRVVHRLAQGAGDHAPDAHIGEGEGHPGAHEAED